MNCQLVFIVLIHAKNSFVLVINLFQCMYNKRSSYSNVAIDTLQDDSVDDIYDEAIPPAVKDDYVIIMSL